MPCVWPRSPPQASPSLIGAVAYRLLLATRADAALQAAKLGPLLAKDTFLQPPPGLPHPASGLAAEDHAGSATQMTRGLQLQPGRWARRQDRSHATARQRWPDAASLAPQAQPWSAAKGRTYAVLVTGISPLEPAQLFRKHFAAEFPSTSRLFFKRGQDASEAYAEVNKADMHRCLAEVPGVVLLRRPGEDQKVVVQVH